jgi:uncharacterized protein YdhG (YjbR/CyaY superfamily)
VARYASIDDYIASFPPEVRPTLEAVRQTIRRAAPGADETISYGIPTFTLDGRYIAYFAGWKRHISLYPIPDVDEDMDRELAPYRAGKGSLRFPLVEPIPHRLIERVVALLVSQRLGHDRS